MTTTFTAEEIDSVWNYGDPADSERRFRKVLAETTPGSRAHAEVLTQVARAQGLQRKFDAAHATLDTVGQEIGEQGGRVKARYLLERGRVFNSARQPDSARPLFLAALEAAQAAGEHFYAVDAAHMLGIVETGEAAVNWNVRAMELAEQASEPRARNWLGPLYNNLGWTFHDLGDYPRALELFEKGVAFREAQGQAAETRIARWAVARCWRSLGRLEEALAAQRELLTQQPAGTRDGFVFEELGECLLALGRAEEARPYFAEAYTELAQDEWLVEKEPDRLKRLKELRVDQQGGFDGHQRGPSRITLGAP